MIARPEFSLLLAVSLFIFLASSTLASSRKYKNAVVHADDSAWYVDRKYKARIARCEHVLPAGIGWL